MEMKSKQNLNILVTGVGGPAGINAARLLQEEEGVMVVGCDIDEKSSGRFFVDTFLIAPRVSDKKAYQAWLEETIATHAIDILIPTVHEELPVLSAFSDTLPCTVILSTPASIAIGDDKVLAYEWASEHLLDNYIPWCTLADWTPQWSASEQFFIKPRQGRGARGCRVATKAELLWQKGNEANLRDTIVMEVMPGTEWTVDAYIGKDGAVVYTLVRERVGLAGGISIKGVTLKNKAVIDATTKLLAALSCRGPVCIQWKADSQGTPRFIEINPRLSGGLMISRAAGVNPIANILREHRGETLTEQDWDEVTVLGYLDYKKLEE